MFRLIRLMSSLAVLGLLAYGATTVKLGKRTLLEHLQAIASSSQGKELVDGVKDKAKEVGDKARHALSKEAGAADGGTRSEDNLTPEERSLLRKLIKRKLSEGGKGPEKKAPHEKAGTRPKPVPAEKE